MGSIDVLTPLLHPTLTGYPSTVLPVLLPWYVLWIYLVEPHGYACTCTIRVSVGTGGTSTGRGVYIELLRYHTLLLLPTLLVTILYH